MRVSCFSIDYLARFNHEKGHKRAFFVQKNIVKSKKIALKRKKMQKCLVY